MARREAAEHLAHWVVEEEHWVVVEEHLVEVAGVEENFDLREQKVVEVRKGAKAAHFDHGLAE